MERRLRGLPVCRDGLPGYNLGPMSLASGTKLGPYEIVAPLGAGGMGEVYRAKDTRLGRDVAIKILSEHLSSDPQLRERFEREARSISSLNHPRICTLHDIGHQDGVDYLVMEYLEGESLAERLRKGALPLKETLRIGMEVCDALEVAHRAGIVHRDLKPANIMLTKSGAKLMDFGLAKTSQAVASGGSGRAMTLSAAKTLSGPSPISPLTTAGAVVGTIQYMSPEQIEGGDSDARSDIFALGSVLYEMATGKRAFDGKSQISVASAILEKDPEPMSAIQPLTPPALEHVVSSCLAKNADDRFQSARDVRLELKWIAEGGSQVTQQAVTRAAKRTSRILPWAIATAAVLALVAGSAFFLRRPEKPDLQYNLVSYREGELGAARFTHDGQTVVYSGRWEGGARQVSTYRLGSAGSRDLGISSAMLAGVSSQDELAVLVNCEHIFLLDCGGTLATVSLVGGSPLEIAGDIAYADWSPDGKQLVVSKFSSGGATLEYPLGHVLLQQNAGWFGHPRISPDGKTIAFENHPVGGEDDGSVDVVDLSGKRTVLSKGWISLEGLAWSANGKEVWFASNSPHTGWADTVRAVTLSGKIRTVLQLPSMRLHDISSNGRLLVSRESWGFQLVGFFPGDKEEHFYSWLDNTNPSGLSSDGRTLSFDEQGEVWSIANQSQSYVRATDGSPPVSLGPGHATISPDGKWLLTTNRTSNKLTMQPVPFGAARELSTPGLSAFAHATWSDDGRFITYDGQTTTGEWNTYVQSIAGGEPTLVPNGGANSYPKLSSDGGTVALRGSQGGINLYRLNGNQATPLPGTNADEGPIRFANNDKSLLVGQGNGIEITLTLVDLASGHRTPWKQFKARSWDPTGIVVTPDLKYYAYQIPRFSSVLYTVENAH
jgi:eukaryotic-like serine/threonine-protein kinase